MPVSEVRFEDQMQFMNRYEDDFFDIAIVDPNYGLGDKLLIGGKKGALKFSTQYMESGWVDTVPEQSYFEELFRVSKNQIIWGGNYFKLPVYRCPIVWDKQQPWDNYSAFEMAWTSFDKPAKMYRLRQAGFIGECKIHPTQKPVALYKWQLKCFANAGDKILDTGMGSQSSRIAAYDMGFDYYGCDNNIKFFTEGSERFNNHIKQLTLF